jgi:hypothetical protein
VTSDTVGAVTAGLLLTLTVACSQPPATVDQGATNQALGLQLVTVPPDFTVAVNDGKRLELVPTDASIGGTLWFEVGPIEDGLNLVAAVKGHQRRIQESLEADYMGGQELVTPLGAAFYSRGRFLAGVTETEETVVFLRHPAEVRLLTISYRYPAGVDSSVRVQQLLDVVGEIEALPRSAESAQ